MSLQLQDLKKEEETLKLMLTEEMNKLKKMQNESQGFQEWRQRKWDKNFDYFMSFTLWQKGLFKLIEVNNSDF